MRPEVDEPGEPDVRLLIGHTLVQIEAVNAAASALDAKMNVEHAQVIDTVRAEYVSALETIGIQVGTKEAAGRTGQRTGGNAVSAGGNEVAAGG